MPAIVKNNCPCFLLQDKLFKEYAFQNAFSPLNAII